MAKGARASQAVDTRALTKRGQQRLDRYIEQLIDVAAKGQAGFAEWHRRDIEYIFAKHSRKRPVKE